MAGQNEAFIKFFGPLVPNAGAALMRAIDLKVKAGVDKLTLLISTPGGDVFHGISIFNYLRGLPVEVNTHNFGSADSIGIVLLCAGSKRFSVPHARFLIHSVQVNFAAQSALEENQLEERLKGLRIDMGNIARIVGDTVGRPSNLVLDDMAARTTLYPEQAIEYGLVHEIRSELFPPEADVVVVQPS